MSPLASQAVVQLLASTNSPIQKSQSSSLLLHYGCSRLPWGATQCHHRLGFRGMIGSLIFFPNSCLKFVRIYFSHFQSAQSQELGDKRFQMTCLNAASQESLRFGPLDFLESDCNEEEHRRSFPRRRDTKYKKPQGIGGWLPGEFGLILFISHRSDPRSRGWNNVAVNFEDQKASGGEDSFKGSVKHADR